MPRGATAARWQGAAAFAPSSLSGLALWLDAQNINGANNGGLSDGDPLAQWNDLSGNSRHVTQATSTKRPLYKATTGPGSRPVVKYDGVDDVLTNATAVAPDATLFVVAQAVSLAASPWVFSMSGPGGWGIATISGTWSPTYRVKTNYSTSPSPAVGTGWHMVAMIPHSTAVPGFWQDGTALTATDAFGGYVSNAGASTYVGAYDGGDVFWNGSIQAVVVYNRALSTTERQQVETYLRARYGTP